MQARNARARTIFSADEMRPGAGLLRLRMRGTGSHTLHHPGQVTAQLAQGLGPLGIQLHLARAHAINHIPVKGTHQRLVVVGDILVQAVQGGTGAAAAGHSHRGARLVGQLAAGGIIQAVQQCAEGAIRARKIRGAANHNTINGIQLVVDVVVKLILHTAAPGFEALAAAYAALHRGSTYLHNLRFHPGRVHGLRHHAQSLESIAICIRAAIDKKSFHANQSSMQKPATQVNSAQTKRSIDPAGACVV